MTAKQYLMRVTSADQMINSKLEQIETLRNMASMGSKLMTDMPGSPNRNIHRMENTIVKIVELEKEINRDIDKLVDLKTEVYAVINAIKNAEYKTLLEQRYLCDRDWKDIAKYMKYNERYVYKLHGKALEAVVLPAWAITAESGQ